jgi:hypothetical protein
MTITFPSSRPARGELLPGELVDVAGGRGGRGADVAVDGDMVDDGGLFVDRGLLLDRIRLLRGEPVAPPASVRPVVPAAEVPVRSCEVSAGAGAGAVNGVDAAASGTSSGADPAHDPSTADAATSQATRAYLTVPSP